MTIYADLVIREASMQEAQWVLDQIPEFSTPVSLTALQQRLTGVPSLLLVAEYKNQMVGVKIGYQQSDTVFYSWLGGVLTTGRGQGVAQALLDAQEAWVVKKGYKALTVKSRNRFSSMLRLLIKNSYIIEGIEKKESALDYRLYFRKSFSNIN